VGRARITLKNIVRAGLGAGGIIDSIRAITNEDSYLRAPLDLNELIREVLVFVENELEYHHIAVRTTLNEMIPSLFADRVQLQQVILNLIKNAIEAMKVVEGHRLLRIETEFDGSQNLVCTVQDSGIGIESKKVDRIFDRFYTTKSDGLGMGLAICRTIIEAHGGHLRGDANVPRGATFQFTIPCAKQSMGVKRTSELASCSAHTTVDDTGDRILP
jgi:signal transduction histidine kinase